MSGSSSTTSTRGVGAVRGAASMSILRTRSGSRRGPDPPAARARPCRPRASGGRSLRDQRLELVRAERVVRALGGLQDPPRELLVALVVAVLPQPVAHVREPRHGPDLDALLPPHHRGGDRGIYAIGEPGVALRLRLDDRRGV